MTASDPLGVWDTLEVGARRYAVVRPDRLAGLRAEAWARRPFTTRILVENLLRHQAQHRLDPATIRALAQGELGPNEVELPFLPGRVLLQDFTGVPVVVDLAAMRSAVVSAGASADRVNPIVPIDLVVDHSVQVVSFRSPRSPLINLDREYQRNSERYAFLRWGRGAFRDLRVVPPGNGICHQVNLEHLATVVAERGPPGAETAFPDTVIGTDSHTTMVNGVSVLGWGVGGIEAEAVMLGEPYFLAPPRVVGVRLGGELPEGATATDLVLTVTRALREHGVVEKFVEFFGPGLRHLTVADRATISNMCPEYGATAAMFPIDEATLAYLRGTGRPNELVARVEAYARRVGLWGPARFDEPEFDERVEIDLGGIVPTVSGPKNPEESVPLSRSAAAFGRSREEFRRSHPRPAGASPADGVRDGSIVIAAITSCTNTSNPSVMVGAGLIARRAVELGLKVPPYVKTSLAPGSKVVTAYLERAGLLEPLAQLGFGLVGFGCTTCIGNSGPLPEEVERAIEAQDAYVVAVLSGNRNFEARIHTRVRANYLMSPMLVVAHALAGRMDLDLTREPLGRSKEGRPVFLRDLWPTGEEVRRIVERSLDPEMFREKYRAIFVGDRHWEELDVPGGLTYPWRTESTYLQEPPYLHLPPPPLDGPELLRDGRALLVLGDRVSTDHISPAGEILAESPAGRYLLDHGVPESEFNTYGTRRGNHEVMVRGTFANVRLRNALVAPREGGYTLHLPDGASASVFDAAEQYRAEGVPLLVLAGASYGQGSSRDWAAKGPRLLGVRAILAESYERIHRSNLIDMGVLPLQYPAGSSARSLGLTGRERFTLRPRGGRPLEPRGPVDVIAERDDGAPPIRFAAELRVYSAVELAYLRSGGILPYVRDRLVGPATAAATGRPSGARRSRAGSRHSRPPRASARPARSGPTRAGGR